MVKGKEVPPEETIPAKLFILHWCKYKAIYFIIISST
jgi:hypothetical protein